MHLVEHDERLRVFGQMTVDRRLRRHLRVGDHGAVVMPCRRPMTVAEPGVETDVHASGGIGPLRLQMLGRGDHDDAVDLAHAHCLLYTSDAADE